MNTIVNAAKYYTTPEPNPNLKFSKEKDGCQKSIISLIPYGDFPSVPTMEKKNQVKTTELFF